MEKFLKNKLKNSENPKFYNNLGEFFDYFLIIPSNNKFIIKNNNQIRP